MCEEEGCRWENGFCEFAHNRKFSRCRGRDGRTPPFAGSHNRLRGWGIFWIVTQGRPARLQSGPTLGFGAKPASGFSSETVKLQSGGQGVQEPLSPERSSDLKNIVQAFDFTPGVKGGKSRLNGNGRKSGSLHINPKGFARVPISRAHAKPHTSRNDRPLCAVLHVPDV